MAEAALHRLGYRYTGPGNLYGVALAEMEALGIGMELQDMADEGTSGFERDYLDQLAEELG